MDYKIHVADLNFLGQKNGIAAFIIETKEGLILVESGPHSTLKVLENKISSLGYKMDDVKHVLLTHIHLDHAGAAWCFAESGAHVYVHPFGYAHILDPSKLLASAKQIYKEAMDMLWGTLKPIAADQMHQVADLQTISLLGLNFTAHHTPGHAKHHIAWELDDILFTGDVAGVCINHGPVIPPCPPPDINIEDWIVSIERIGALDHIKTFYLTHFGEIDAKSDHLQLLKNSLLAYASFFQPYAEKSASVNDVLDDFRSFVRDYLIKNGLNPADADAYQAANPADMSATGLLRYWSKKLAI